MTAGERRLRILEALEESRCSWSTVAYLAREVRCRRSQVALDLRALSKAGQVQLQKANHVLDGGLNMGRQRAVTILLARRL